MRFSVLLIFLLGIIESATAQNQDETIILLNSKDDRVNLYQYVSVYTDSSKKQAFNEVINCYKKHLFKKKNEDGLNLGIGNYNHWLAFEVRNNTSENLDMVINSESNTMDEIEWVILENDSLIRQYRYSGWMTSYENHALPSRTHSIDLHLRSQKTYTCFLKVNRKVGTTTVLLEILSREDFYQGSLYQVIFILCFVGAFVIIFLIGIVLFLLTLQWVYLAYSLQTICFALYFIYRFGIINMIHFDEHYLWMGPHGSFLLSAALGASIILFMMLFLPVKKILSSAIIKLVYFIIGVFICLIIFRFNTFLSKNEYKLYYCFVIIAIGIILFITVKGLFIKDKRVRVFLLGISSLLLYLIYFCFCLILGKTDKYVLYALLVVGFLEISVFGVALLLRFIGFEKRNLKLMTNLSNAQKELLTTQETERKRLAQDLHDDLGGTLSVIKGKVANEMQNSETLNLVEKAIEDLRNISRNLLPPELANNGLSKAIQQSIERLQSASKIDFTIIIFGSEKRMSEERELNVYRVISELLNNIIKHSKATKATVQVIFHDEYVHISVEDNGVGIKTEEKNWGIGLKNVNSRVELLKAKFLKDSNENGTTFIIEVSYS